MVFKSYWLLIFAIFLVEIVQIVVAKPIVFYDPVVDHVEVLDNNTFDELIYEGPRASFVEFYANWCARCQRFSPTFKDIARSTLSWHKNILRVAVVDCAAAENVKLCRQHNVEFYPTFYLFEANAPKGITGVEAPYFHTRDEFFGDIIDFIEKQPDKPKTWPNMAIFGNKLKDLFKSKQYHNVKYALLIFEDDQSFLARKIILDFNEHASVFPIRCVTTKGNPKLAGKLDVDDDDLPLAFLVENRKNESPTYQSLNKVIKSLNKEKKINTVDINPEGVVLDEDYTDTRFEYVSMIKTFIEYSVLTFDEEDAVEL